MLTVPIVAVGNSRGIRIPKKLLEQLGSPQSVHLDFRDGTLVISPLNAPRQGWDNPELWKGADLDEEDHAWLDAALIEDEA